jgi:hypothetical protein
MEQFSNMSLRWSDGGLQLNHLTVLQQVDRDPVVFVFHYTSPREEKSGKWTPAPGAQNKRARAHDNQNYN